jgi:hypothetical protein
MSEARPPAANTRLRKKRIGSIGVGVRISQMTNSTSSTTPPPSGSDTSKLAHPTAPTRITAQTTPNNPALPSTTPARSSFLRGPRVSASRSRPSAISIRPTGTFSQKMARQPALPVRAPPTSGPRAAPSPPIPPHAPSTAPRRSGGVTAESIVRVSGTKSAPPAPCNPRAATSMPIVGASAAAADPAVKTATPIVNIRRRPNRSPNALPVSSNTAKLSV